MSHIVITSTDHCLGVPRLEDASLGVFEDEDTFDKEYFCGQGHSFSLTFVNGVNPPSYWECPQCQTIAPDFPPDAF